MVKVVDLTEGDHLERELMMIKYKASGAARDEIKRTADIFRGQIIDITPTTYTVQLVGSSKKLDAFIAALETANLIEVVRTGVSGIARGEKTLSI